MDATETRDQGPGTGDRAITAEWVKAAKKDALVTACEQYGLSAAGKADELRQRLLAKLAGADKGFVPGKTLCPSCGGTLLVMSTVAPQYRRVKCAGCGYRDKMAW
jgi:ribosomal protein S27AE